MDWDGSILGRRELVRSTRTERVGGSRLKMWELGDSKVGWRDLVSSTLGGREVGGYWLGRRELVDFRLRW